MFYRVKEKLNTVEFKYTGPFKDKDETLKYLWKQCTDIEKRQIENWDGNVKLLHNLVKQNAKYVTIIDLSSFMFS